MTQTASKGIKQLQSRLIADMDKCTGCGSCALACSFAKTNTFHPGHGRIRVLKLDESGVDAPVFCQQCEEPRCVEACPKGALVRRPENGILVIDEQTCDGCAICAVACPYGAIAVRPEVDHVSKQSGKKNRQMLKCDLCGGQPQCVKWCETGALAYVGVEEQGRIKQARENLIMVKKRFEIEHRIPLWKY